MELSIEKFKKYVDSEFSLEQLEALEDIVNDRLIMLKTAIDKANHKPIKGFSINEQQEAEAFIYESLRDWFKKEKWVRISSSGKIAGKCGTSKNKKNPDRCLPLAKARSLSKGQRAATAAKKKKAGAKGKTVVKNTKKATVKKETANPQDGKAAPYGSGFKPVKMKKEDIKNLVVGLLHESQNPNFKVLKKGPYYRYLPTDDLFTDLDALGHHGLQRSPDNLVVYKTANELLDTFEDMYYDEPERAIAWADQNDDIIKFLGTNEVLMEKDDRCTRLAKQKYDTWPSAYASGAVVRCRRGEIWKKK